MNSGAAARRDPRPANSRASRAGRAFNQDPTRSSLIWVPEGVMVEVPFVDCGIGARSPGLPIGCGLLRAWVAPALGAGNALAGRARSVAIELL